MNSVLIQSLLVFSLSLKYLNKLKKRVYVGAGLFGIAVGFLSALTIVSWGGVAVFIFMFTLIINLLHNLLMEMLCLRPR